MTKNIIIIGSSGAIGSSFLKHYAEEDKNNIIYALSRSEAASPSSNIHNVSIDIESDSSISKHLMREQDGLFYVTLMVELYLMKLQK